MAPHDVIMDVLGGGNTLTFGELGENDIKVDISISGPIYPFFLLRKKNATRIQSTWAQAESSQSGFITDEACDEARSLAFHQPCKADDSEAFYG